MEHPDKVLDGDLGALKLRKLRDAGKVCTSAREVHSAASKQFAVPPYLVTLLIECDLH